MPSKLWSLDQISYNPITGELSKNGKLIGSRRKDGYIEIGQGRAKNNLLAHRVAWRLTYGYWPSEIDHIDGNPSNNKLSNLKEKTHQENLMNSKFHRAGNKAKRRRPHGWRRPRSMHFLWS